MGNYEIGVDIGGTFTDVILINPSGSVHSHKLLSTPDNFSNAMIKGIEQICARANIEPSSITKIVHGTTVVTNACIERGQSWPPDNPRLSRYFGNRARKITRCFGSLLGKTSSPGSPEFKA